MYTYTHTHTPHTHTIHKYIYLGKPILSATPSMTACVLIAFVFMYSVFVCMHVYTYIYTYILTWENQFEAWLDPWQPAYWFSTAIPIIVEGHETAFNGFEYQFTTGKLLKNLKPTLNYYGNGSMFLCIVYEYTYIHIYTHIHTHLGNPILGITPSMTTCVLNSYVFMYSVCVYIHTYIHTYAPGKANFRHNSIHDDLRLEFYFFCKTLQSLRMYVCMCVCMYVCNVWTLVYVFWCTHRFLRMRVYMPV